MHAIKGGWVGQTFALAKCNDSSGKKSRIRRSKEERKEMVVSFIKKYQSLNNGNFPSLNLTHKEVGGSFYTVREIVREVIQENRVLGPAKLLQDEENSDQSLNHYPLGTISVEPESSLSKPLNGSLFISDQNQNSTREYYMMSNGVIAETAQQAFDDEEITEVNIAPVAENGKICGPETDNVQVIDLVETRKGSVQEATSENLTNQVAELEVMASLIEPVADQPNIFGASYSEEKVSTPEEKDVENMHVVTGKDGSSGSSATERLIVEGKEMDTPIGQSMDRNSGLAAEKTMEKPLCDLEIQKSGEEVSASKATITEMADVIVETFPLRPVVKSTDYICENSGEGGEPSAKEKGSKEASIGAGKGNLLSKGVPKSNSSFSEDGKEAGNPAQSLLEANTLVVDKKVEDLRGLPLRSSISPTDQMTVNSSSPSEANADTSCNEKAGATAEVVDAPSSNLLKTVNGTHLSDGGSQSNSKEVRLKGEGQHSGSSEEGAKATLDRINIKTWEGGSAKQKVHPIMAIFKSFIDSFIKFWSE